MPVLVDGREECPVEWRLALLFFHGRQFFIAPARGVVLRCFSLILLIPLIP